MMKYLDSVQSDDEHNMDNLLNDSDTGYECVTQDTEDFVKAESSVIQEKILEAVIHPLSTNPGDNGIDKESTNIPYHIQEKLEASQLKNFQGAVPTESTSPCNALLMVGSEVSRGKAMKEHKNVCDDTPRSSFISSPPNQVEVQPKNY